MQDDSHKGIAWFIYKSNLLIKGVFQKEFNCFDITTEQWSVLNELYREDRCNQKELSKICFKDQAALTRILDILEKKELLKREKSPYDRREFLILITPKGRATIEKMSPLVEAVNERIYADLDKGEREILRSLLQKLTKSLE